MSSKLSDFNSPFIKSSNLARKYLYTDLDLRMTLKPIGNKDLVLKTDIDAVKNSVKNLILTNFYERPFQPFLGANLSALLFELASPFTAFTIQNEIQRVISEYEKRVEDLKVNVVDKADENAYHVSVEFKVKSMEKTAVQLNLFLNRLR